MLTLLASALAAWELPRMSAAPPVERLTLALSSTPHASLLHLAAAEGYFIAEGLDVSLARVSHGKAALDLLVEGRADFAAAAEVPFVIGVLEGHPLRVIASMMSTSREMAVVARRDRGIAAPGDLLGRRIGVTFGTSGDYFLWAFLIRHKLPPERVVLVNLPPSHMVAALELGTIDAASLWQPLRRGAEAALGARGVSFPAPDAYTVTHLVLGRVDSIGHRPEAARKVVRALLRAEQHAQSQPDDAMRIVSRELDLALPELRAHWADVDFRVDLRQSQLVTWEDEARWAQARGHVDPGPMPNFLRYADMDALKASRADRVTIVH